MENSINSIVNCTIGSSFKINNCPPFYKNLNLYETIAVLVQQLEPEKIFLVPDQTQVPQLLVIIPDHDLRTIKELLSLKKIMLLSKNGHKLQLIKASTFENNFQISPIYSTVTCNAESLLYDDGYYALPSLSERELLIARDRINNKFSENMADAKMMLTGARCYRKSIPLQAVSYLKQAVILCLTTFTQAITGQLNNTSSLKELLKMSATCNQQIPMVFVKDQYDLRLLALLEADGPEFPVNKSLTVKRSDVDALIEKIISLCDLAERTFANWMNRYNTQILKFTY